MSFFSTFYYIIIISYVCVCVCVYIDSGAKHLNNSLCVVFLSCLVYEKKVRQKLFSHYRHYCCCCVFINRCALRCLHIRCGYPHIIVETIMRMSLLIIIFRSIKFCFFFFEERMRCFSYLKVVFLVWILEMRERIFFWQPGRFKESYRVVPKIKEPLYYSLFLPFSILSNSSLKVNKELIKSWKKSNKG